MTSPVAEMPSLAPSTSRSIPTPVASIPSLPSATVLPPISPPTLAAEVNLAIPFAVQAPYQNWEAPYDEFCEEASVLMAASYILNRTLPNAATIDAGLLAIKAFEEERFGYYKDTTAEETAVILREYFNISNVAVVYDPTIEDIKKAIAAGRAVIVPAAGRQLLNPYFRQPGPLYHMLVIKGYLRDGTFITNDPGTRRGADFLYDPEVLLGAVHDWNGGDVENGRKVMIVVG